MVRQKAAKRLSRRVSVAAKLRTMPAKSSHIVVAAKGAKLSWNESRPRVGKRRRIINELYSKGNGSVVQRNIARKVRPRAR